jgi:hypothetical protein
LSQITPAQSEFVSKLEGFAVLGPDRTPLAVGGSLTPAALDEILAQEGGKNAFAKSVQENAVVSEALPGDEHRRLALVPAMEDGKLARVYAFTVDQTAAAGLTNIALTVVTLTTSLLIVMGFSCRRRSPRGAFANAGWPRIRSAISPCTIRSPACPTGYSSASISIAPWRAPSGTVI